MDKRFEKKKHFRIFSTSEALVFAFAMFVICFIVISPVVGNWHKRQVVMQLKKFQTTMSKMLEISQINNGQIASWGVEAGTPQGSEALLNRFEKDLYIVKNCGTTDYSCTKFKNYKTLGKIRVGEKYDPNSDYYAKALLMDNTVIFVKSTHGSACDGVYGKTSALKSVCGELNVDLNGAGAPNRLGVDTFYFYITKEGLVPMGTRAEEPDYKELCNKNNILNEDNGVMCSGWVTQMNNFDYLKRYVSW